MRADLLTFHKVILGMGGLILLGFLYFLEKLVQHHLKVILLGFMCFLEKRFEPQIDVILVVFVCFLEKLFALQLDVIQALNCALLIVLSTE